MILALCPFKCGTSFYINKTDELNNDLFFHLNYNCFKFNIMTEQIDENARFCFSNGIIEIVKGNDLKNHCDYCKKNEPNPFVSLIIITF